MNRIKSFFSYKMWRNALEGGASKLSFLSRVFAAAGFIVPLVLGISAGWLGSIYIEYSVASRSAELKLNVATNASAAQGKRTEGKGLADFLSANPFSISALKEVVGKIIITPVSNDNTEAKNSFAKASLAWTFPEIGAWVQDNANNRVDFIPIGESFEEYKLTEVLYDRAIFRDEENNDITKFLYLVEAGAGSTQANALPQPEEIPQTMASRGIIPATPDGQQGVISQELIDELMMNPFGELRKVRLRPKFEGNEPIGIEVQWTQHDSLLGNLGLARGDVIKSLNGIPMKNMGDIMNSINSLINGKRFDVELLRGNAPINLTYIVR